MCMGANDNIFNDCDLSSWCTYSAVHFLRNIYDGFLAHVFTLIVYSSYSPQ